MLRCSAPSVDVVVENTAMMDRQNAHISDQFGLMQARRTQVAGHHSPRYTTSSAHSLGITWVLGMMIFLLRNRHDHAEEL